MVAMSDLQLYLDHYDANQLEASHIARRSAQAVQSRELKLVNVVLSLSQYINNDDEHVRFKAQSYLAHVLSFVAPGVLSAQERLVLFNYLLTIVECDDKGLAPAVRGLTALELLGEWDYDHVKSILNMLLDKTHPLRQNKTQTSRYSVLRLIDTLMRKHRPAMESLHESTPDFLSRFIAYFAGEKDPRNLMLVFSILKVPMAEWHLGNDAQALFEAVFNYFPIVFRPPPDDPYGISAENLKDRQRECICSTSAFAPYAFPALLDRLDSTTMNTKRDVLQVITSAATEYDSKVVSLYASMLWDALKFEILHAQEDDLAQKALEALSAIAVTLSHGPSGPLHAYLKSITDVCIEHLEDAPTKQSQSAGRILSGIASASPGVFNTVIPNVLADIITLYQTSNTAVKRKALLDVVVDLVRADVDVFGDWRHSEALEAHVPSALAQFGEQAFELFLYAASNTTPGEHAIRLVGLEGLLQLSRASHILDQVNISRFIDFLGTLVIEIDTSGEDDLRQAAMKALVEAGHQKPRLVIEQSIPALIGHLSDAAVDSTTAYVPVLEAFAKLSEEQALFATVIAELRSLTLAALDQDASPVYVSALASAMLYANQREAKRRCLNMDESDPVVFTWARKHTGHEWPRALNDDTTLDVLGKNCSVVLRSQPQAVQDDYASRTITSLFHPGSSKNTLPYAHFTNADHTKYVIISTYLLAAFRRETSLPILPSSLLTSLIDLSQVDYLSSRVRTACILHVTLVVNKFLPTASLDATLSPILSSLLNLDFEAPLLRCRIRIFFAILKALVLRNSTLLPGVFSQLLTSLASTAAGRTVARAFATLLHPDPLLVKENHCSVSPLHKQKAFALLVPELTAMFRSAPTDAKPHALIALSGILRWMPQHIFLDDLAPLVPPLLQSLVLQGEDQVKEDALRVLTTVLAEKATVLDEYALSLTNRLLENAVSESGSLSLNVPATSVGLVKLSTDSPPSAPAQASSASAPAASSRLTPPRIRAAALRTLTLVAQRLDMASVVPLQRHVVKQLAAAVDDGRRAVRAQAVRCRAVWLNVGQEDDVDVF